MKWWRVYVPFRYIPDGGLATDLRESLMVLSGHQVIYISSLMQILHCNHVFTSEASLYLGMAPHS